MKQLLKRTLGSLASLVLLMGLSYGCATYHFGKGARVLPGGYDRVAIPMFANKTPEVGIENYFTQELRTQFERSRLARVTSQSDAQMVLVGTVKSVTFAPTVLVTSTSTQLLAPIATLAPTPVPVPPAVAGPLVPNPLPSTVVLAKQYSVTLIVHIEAHKASDDSILWQSDFTSSGVYQAPLLGTPSTASFGPGKNSSDPLYNQNSRQDSIASIAKDMMAEAHDRLTENF